MENYPDFASYLHNPWAFTTKEEEASILVFKRKNRFLDGYVINEHLETTIKKFFGNFDNLHKYGLIHHYNLLKQFVIDYQLIGLILYGTTLDNTDPYNPINIGKYINNSGVTIQLTVQTICQLLIDEYIKKDNVEELCRKTPNFDIYYNTDSDNPIIR